LKVNFISETKPLGLAGIGVHSAFTTFAEGLKNNKVKVLFNAVNDKNCDLIHVHSIGAWSFYKTLNIMKPTVVAAYVMHYEAKGSLLGGKNTGKFLEKYLKRLYNACDCVFAPSEFTKKELKKMKIRRPIVTVSCGVNRDRFKYTDKKRGAFRKRYKISKNDFVVYCVGQLIKRKGLLDFIKVAKALPDVTFVWTGATPMGLMSGDFFKVHLDTLKNVPPNIIFTGFVEDVSYTHSAGDVFFFPTLMENQGIVVLEAASCGKPVIVRDIPVFEGWLKHEKNCCKGKSVKDFVRIIKDLKDNDKKRKKLVKESLSLAEQHNVNRIAKQVIKVYQHLIDGDYEALMKVKSIGY